MKYLNLIWKSLWRKKARTILTMSSIFIAFILFALLGALNYAFKLGADVANAKRLVTLHKVSLIQPLPISYWPRIRQEEGVEDVTHASWFGGYYQDPNKQIASFPVDVESYLRVYPEIKIPEDQYKAFIADREGALVGKPLADLYHWKVGDRVPLISPIWRRADGKEAWEFNIDGIFNFDDPRQSAAFFLFHYDYFNEARGFGKDMVGWYIFTITDVSQADAVAHRIDEGFANSPYETKTSTEAAFAQSFAKQFGDIGFITRSILAAVFFTILLVAGNTMAQSVRERIPEMAVLKTIGFTSRSVLGLVLSESVLIALIGGGLGLLVGWSLVTAIANSPAAAFIGGLFLPAVYVITAILMMVGIGIAAGIFPGLQAMRLSIVEALGRRQ